MKRHIVVVSLLAGFALVGCNPIDAAIDCHSICSRYSECWDANYDVGACEARCRDHSSTDTSYRRNADQCNACIHDRACATVAFNCTLECVSVVP